MCCEQCFSYCKESIPGSFYVTAMRHLQPGLIKQHHAKGFLKAIIQEVLQKTLKLRIQYIRWYIFYSQRRKNSLSPAIFRSKVNSFASGCTCNSAPGAVPIKRVINDRSMFSRSSRPLERLTFFFFFGKSCPSLFLSLSRRCMMI